MPELYSNTELAIVPLQPKTFTCPVNTKGFTITNYSDVPFQVSTDKNEDWGILLPYFTRIYAAKIGDQITLTPQALLNAQAQPLMFVVYDISQVDVTPAIIALAQTSGYQMNVAGSVTVAGTPTMNIGTAPNLNIGTMPAVTIANASIPVSGSVSIASGAVNATIQNASLNSQITNAMISTNPFATLPSQMKTISVAAGASIGIDIFQSLPLGLYDGFFILITSSLGKMASYQIAVSLAEIGGLWTQTYYPYLPVVWSASNSDLGFSNLIATIPTPVICDSIQLNIENISGVDVTNDVLTCQIYGKFASVSNKPVADTIVSSTGNFSTTQTVMTAGDSTKLLKEVHVDFKNTTASPVIYGIYGGLGHGIQLSGPTVPANSSVHEDLYFGNGIPFDDGLWAYSNNAVAQYIGGYSILANK